MVPHIGQPFSKIIIDFAPLNFIVLEMRGLGFFVLSEIFESSEYEFSGLHCRRIIA